MPAAQGVALSDFARACKTAARAVSLYPSTHPTIGAALNRIGNATQRLIPGSDVTITVLPDSLLGDGRAPGRGDGPIAELADLLHQRLVGELRIERAIRPGDWHAFLLLLAQAPHELMAAGGIGTAWKASGRSHLQLREIDYAEVLRERAAGREAEWNRIIAWCLDADAPPFDERALAALLEAVDHPEQFEALILHIQSSDANGAMTVSARAGALLQLLRRLLEACEHRGASFRERVLQLAADASAVMTPELMLALTGVAQSGDSAEATIAADMLDRVGDQTLGRFMGRNIAAEQGATERLAQVFETLVPGFDRKERVLDVAHEEARKAWRDPGVAFEELWQSAASMLRSYSDTSFVATEYARELTAARTRAVDVERVADDPPERVRAWLATVSSNALLDLDVLLLLDLVRVDDDATQRAEALLLAADALERRMVADDPVRARRLAIGLADYVALAVDPAPALLAIDRLATGPLAGLVIKGLRTPDDIDADAIAAVCAAIGPGLVRPLAEGLVAEEQPRAVRRVREILLAFGSAGREAVEQLKSSPNPSVRRTAVEMLRMFGGHDALPELTTLLGDPDPLVQREAIRAIVQLGTSEASAVLERALAAGGPSRSIVQELIALRDDRTVPLLCGVLDLARRERTLADVEPQVVDALGGLAAHPDSTRALRRCLYEGHWWAPIRTAARRRAAAAALRRIGTDDTLAVLREAMKHGTRGVRAAARAGLDEHGGRAR